MFLLVDACEFFTGGTLFELTAGELQFDCTCSGVASRGISKLQSTQLT